MDGSVNKAWGHYATKDFQTYTRHATAVSRIPNTIRTAHIQEVQSSEMTYCMYFYTGNVNMSTYDFIHEGREHNVMRVESQVME